MPATASLEHTAVSERSRAGLPTMVIIATGGTIGSRKDPSTGAVHADVAAEELLASAPDIAALANIELVQWASVNSWNMTPSMMLEVAQEAKRALERPDVTGVVITHGTDTVEETALLAELTASSTKPIVFVVAMRSLSELGADGPRNLQDAVRVAVEPGSANRGVMLVVNEMIHAARYVTKINTVNPHAFDSPDFGPIGIVSAHAVHYLHSPQSRTVLDVTRIEEKVHIVKAVSGEDDRMITWLLETGARGLVIEGSGAGNIPASLCPGVRRAIEGGVPVVLTSRCLYGFLAAAYGTGGAAGGGYDLANLGVIAANHLPAQKARIALMVALGHTNDPAFIADFFSRI